MQLLFLLSILLCSVAADYFVTAPTMAHVSDTVLVEFGTFAKENRSGCWIGLFDAGVVDVSAFPPESIPGAEEPYTRTAPLKYFKCSNDDSETFSNKGYGSKSIRILNYRNDLIFLMFDTQALPQLLASSEILQVLNKAVPSQEHLALTQNTNEMSITWSSINGGQSVRWGTTSGNLGNFVSATSRTYTKNSLCGGISQSVGWKSPNMINTAILKDLPSSKRIYYKVGAGFAWSNESSFVSPFQGTRTGLRVAIIGDTGVQDPDTTRYPGSVRPGALQTLTAFAELAVQTNFTIHLGDLSYSEGYLATWDSYMESIQYAKSVPLMLSWGNHDRQWPGTGTEFQSDDSGGDCGITVSYRFPMPGVGSRVNGGWYSYTAGLVTFIHLNTELQVKRGSTQYNWLQATLRNIDRRTRPWVVVIGHRPLYIVSGRVSALVNLETLFYDYKVDLVIAGHIHYYMRTCFVHNGICINQQGGGYAAPVYVVAGTGGATLASLGSLDTHVVTGVKGYGYLDLQVNDAFTLKVDFIAPGPPTQILDTFKIQRTR